MDEQFLKVAKQAALEAGKIISKYSGKVGKLTIKNDDVSDFATKADLEAEKIIINILSKHFPDHNIIGEEETNINKNSDYTWAIDPLDGTFSFTIGIPNYSVSIGLLRNNKPVLGVIYQPALHAMYYAQNNKGAYLNEDRIEVSSRDNLNRSAVVLDPGHQKKRPEKIIRYFLPLINKIGVPYQIGSAAAALAFIANGIFDADINEAYLWDFAAGAVIVREAGGKVTDFEGNEPDWSKERLNIVASNGLIHDQILEALKS